MREQAGDPTQILYFSRRFWNASSPPSRISQACSRMPRRPRTVGLVSMRACECSRDPVRYSKVCAPVLRRSAPWRFATMTSSESAPMTRFGLWLTMIIWRSRLRFVSKGVLQGHQGRVTLGETLDDRAHSTLLLLDQLRAGLLALLNVLQGGDLPLVLGDHD